MLTDQKILAIAAGPCWSEAGVDPILFARAIESLILAAAQAKPADLMLNGLTREESEATASCMGLVGAKSATAVTHDSLTIGDLHIQAMGRLITAEEIDAIERALTPAKSGPAVPDGWALVPVEPTPTMMNIARGQLAKRNLWGVWRAMLVAAPSPEGAKSGPAVAIAPLLVRDLAASLGVEPLRVCAALSTLGFGPHSVNMAVPAAAVGAVERHFAAPSPKGGAS